MSTNYIIRSQSRSASHTTKIIRKVVQEVHPLTTGETDTPDWVSQLEAIEAEIQCMEHTGIIRPPWAPGLTNQEIMAVAAHEGLNPFRPDWFDSIDSLIIRQAKSGGFKRNVRNTLTELRAKRAQLKGEIAWTR